MKLPLRFPLACILCAVLPCCLVAAPATAAQPALTVSESPTTLQMSDGRSIVSIARQPWRLSWLRPDGSQILREAAKGLLTIDPVINLDYSLEQRPQGIDQAYPGLPTQSFAPLGYRTAAGWSSVTAVLAYHLEGRTLVVQTSTKDGAGAVVRLLLADDGALEMRFTPNAAGVDAVEDAWDAPVGQGYFGTGQRFGALNQRGRSVPLWISHGGGSDRYLDTNEVAVPFFWSPAGWGLWSRDAARGELDFGAPLKRADAVGLTQEDDHLDLVLYTGTPQQIVSTHTARAGRPAWLPPAWAWRPMVWQDADTTTASVLALVSGMASRNIPLGAVWLDNPWDNGFGSFDFDPARFPDPAALISQVHAQGVRLMVWLSPYVQGAAQTTAAARNWIVTGTRSDNNEQTYYPPRGLNPHLDFTSPAASAWWTAGLQGLIARGVDGVKMDRCEEDLSDTSVWVNGQPNRLNHNPYCTLYHRAAWQAFAAQRPNGDYLLLARGGGEAADAQYTGHWAGDNLSVSGQLGLATVRNSLLSQSASGLPFSGSDIGGYDGTRQSGSGDGGLGLGQIGLPSVQTYVRWAQLGALSPIMETPIPPWWVSDQAVTIYRRYATLHDRLAPYTAQYAALAVSQGIPIVRPLAYAFPSDTQAIATEDEYLYGPDLLVAPVTSILGELGLVTRLVYLPAGQWTDFWTGASFTGPTTVLKLAGPEILPLYVRAGAQLPAGVSAAALP